MGKRLESRAGQGFRPGASSAVLGRLPSPSIPTPAKPAPVQLVRNPPLLTPVPRFPMIGRLEKPRPAHSW